MLPLIAAHELPNNCETVEKHVFELKYIFFRRKGGIRPLRSSIRSVEAFLACEIR